MFTIKGGNSSRLPASLPQSKSISKSGAKDVSGVIESRPEATQFQFEVQDLNEPELKEVLLN
ncbi:MAG TPA: hypothetical protein PLJ18_00655 [Niabella sp.]|nr:hypothetical protein [Niabella sp.]